MRFVTDLFIAVTMKKPLKAVMLSALVFPGAGHFFLRRPVPGVIMAGSALTALYFVVAEAVGKAMQISAKIQSGEVPLDATVIAQLVSEQPAGADAQVLNIATVVLVIAWLFGIADSYRVGCMQEK